MQKLNSSLMMMMEIDLSEPVPNHTVSELHFFHATRVFVFTAKKTRFLLSFTLNGSCSLATGLFLQSENFGGMINIPMQHPISILDSTI